MSKILSILFLFVVVLASNVNAQEASFTVVDDSVSVNPNIRFYNPKKAGLLSAALPGAGQIYNRKYWKLPILYGGLVAMGMAIDWNNGYYVLYKNAYSDWVDDNPTSNRWQKVWTTVDPGSEDWFEEVLEGKKDRYRRDRDYMIILTVGLYVLNIIDANIDAHLSDFDISTNLSMKIEPELRYDAFANQSSLGLKCRLRF